MLDARHHGPTKNKPSLSSVAGILSPDGGLRIVVADRDSMRHHLAPGEKLYVVPDYLVIEPVPWERVPQVIEAVQKHVAKMLAPVNHCGECTECCFRHFILDGNFRKPSNTLCGHCSVGFGCKLYHQRPSACEGFKCIWLKSQSLNDVMPPELRPDRCGCYFTEDSQGGDPLLFEVHGEPNADAWAYINEMQRLGYKAKKVTSYVGEKESEK